MGVWEGVLRGAVRGTIRGAVRGAQGKGEGQHSGVGSFFPSCGFGETDVRCSGLLTGDNLSHLTSPCTCF